MSSPHDSWSRLANYEINATKKSILKMKLCQMRSVGGGEYSVNSFPSSDLKEENIAALQRERGEK